MSGRRWAPATADQRSPIPRSPLARHAGLVDGWEHGVGHRAQKRHHRPVVRIVATGRAAARPPFRRHAPPGLRAHAGPGLGGRADLRPWPPRPSGLPPSSGLAAARKPLRGMAPSGLLYSSPPARHPRRRRRRRGGVHPARTGEKNRWARSSTPAGQRDLGPGGGLRAGPLTRARRPVAAAYYCGSLLVPRRARMTISGGLPRQVPRDCELQLAARRQLELPLGLDRQRAACSIRRQKPENTLPKTGRRVPRRGPGHDLPADAWQRRGCNQTPVQEHLRTAPRGWHARERAPHDCAAPRRRPPESGPRAGRERARRPIPEGAPRSPRPVTQRRSRGTPPVRSSLASPDNKEDLPFGRPSWKSAFVIRASCCPPNAMRPPRESGVRRRTSGRDAVPSGREATGRVAPGQCGSGTIGDG